MKAGIPEAGGSRIKKKQLVFFALGLVIISFLIGHLTNTLPSGVQMSKELMAAQLVDSTDCDTLKKEVPREGSNWCDQMDGKAHDYCWGEVTWLEANHECPEGYYSSGCDAGYAHGGWTLLCKKQPDCDSLKKKVPQKEEKNWCDQMDGEVRDYCWGEVTLWEMDHVCPEGYHSSGCDAGYAYGKAGWTLLCKKLPGFTVCPPL